MRRRNTRRVDFMNSSNQSSTRASVDRETHCRRRQFLGTMMGGSIASIGFAHWLTLCADELRKQGRACILLWMQGGASQLETWDPKPDHPHGGATRSIPTAVPGIHIAENLPHLARTMADLCVIRTLSSREANHPRATHLMQTSYLPNAAIKYPSIAAFAARQWQGLGSDLPGFVEIGEVKGRNTAGGGFLGVNYEPFYVQDPSRAPENTRLLVDENRLGRRLLLLRKIESQVRQDIAKSEREANRLVYERAVRLVLSPQMNAFDVSVEPASQRDAYGQNPFGNGCLLARRLVESGVTFVKVNLGDWDTHSDNFNRSRELCQQLDQPFAALVADLRQRGMLDRTLVVWMGEFGRSPKINAQAGRDHHPRAFSVVLAGGGVRGGELIGATTDDGEDVQNQPVKVADLVRTMCACLKIDADQENISNAGRPVRAVDGGEVLRDIVAPAIDAECR